MCCLFKYLSINTSKLNPAHKAGFFFLFISGGFIEIKEDVYEDTIEHLHRLKAIACKMIKKLAEHSEIYDHDRDEYDEDEEFEARERKGVRKARGRYEY